MTSQKLPSDMIFEILSRTRCLKTLDTCKCVSKQWKEEIIENSNFMSAYCKRTNNLCGFFIQKSRRCLQHESMFVSIDHQSQPQPYSAVRCQIARGINILASSDQGILLCRGSSINHPRSCCYYVCKPTTKQWLRLPNPKRRYKPVGEAIAVLGTDPLRFKILRISRIGFTRLFDHSNYRCEIFNSEEWSWRELESVRVPCTREMKFRGRPAVHVKGSFHWVTTDNEILSFHESTESFTTFPLPELIMLDMDKYEYSENRVMEYQGRLGLSCCRGDTKIELWVLEGETWRKHMEVDHGRVEGNPVKNEEYSITFFNAGTLLLKTYNKVVLYKIEEGSFNEVKLDRAVWYAEKMFPFRADFEELIA